MDRSLIKKRVQDIEVQPDEDGWVSVPFHAPFFEKEALLSFHRNDGVDWFPKDAEEALNRFCNEMPVEAKTTIERALYQNWIYYNDLVGVLDRIEIYHPEQEHIQDWMIESYENAVWLSKLTAPEKIWEYLEPSEIIIAKGEQLGLEDDLVYLSVMLKTAWDDEHALEVVFENGNRFLSIE